MAKYSKIKEDLKELATSIRTVRKDYRVKQREGFAPIPEGCYYSKEKVDMEVTLYGNCTSFRHKHIAYCLARGRTMLQIEPKVGPGNEPDDDRIQDELARYGLNIPVAEDEAVCASS